MNTAATAVLYKKLVNRDSSVVVSKDVIVQMLSVVLQLYNGH